MKKQKTVLSIKEIELLKKVSAITKSIIYWNESDSSKLQDAIKRGYNIKVIYNAKIFLNRSRDSIATRSRHIINSPHDNIITKLTLIEIKKLEETRKNTKCLEVWSKEENSKMKQAIEKGYSARVVYNAKIFPNRSLNAIYKRARDV